MKKLITPLIFALLTALPLAGISQTSLENDPAYLPIDKMLDLKTIRPEVNVNLPHFLLKDALAGLAAADTNSATPGGIDIAGLLKDVKLIRVVVIQANETNRLALEKGVKALRAHLEEKWTVVVNVPEENVGVYAISDAAGETTSGLAVLVNDGGEAVIGNIVGHVSISKLVGIATKSGKFPKDFLQKLQSLGTVATEPSVTKTGDGSSPSAPSGDSNSTAESSSAK